MIVSEQKPFEEILQMLKGKERVFLIGCGDCATACKSGGLEQLAEMDKLLNAQGKQVVGQAVPDSTCVAAKLKSELSRHMPQLRQAEAVVVCSCGLGVQAVKDNDRFNLFVVPGCNSFAATVMDAQGNFLEKCSLCGQCLLGITGGICPISLCPKSLLNGPCGGMHKGKCELDDQRDCAWVLIYRELEKRSQLDVFKKINPPRDFSKTRKPYKKTMIRTSASG